MTDQKKKWEGLLSYKSIDLDSGNLAYFICLLIGFGAKILHILHPKLQAESHFIVDLSLSSLFLMDDRRYPWLILVPRIPNISEIFELSNSDQELLWQEVNAVNAFAHRYFAADKMNVASLGNIVPQLHVHIIARKVNDASWPKPVWGLGERVPYERDTVQRLIAEISEQFRTYRIALQISAIE